MRYRVFGKKHLEAPNMAVVLNTIFQIHNSLLLYGISYYSMGGSITGSTGVSDGGKVISQSAAVSS